MQSKATLSLLSLEKEQCSWLKLRQSIWKKILAFLQYTCFSFDEKASKLLTGTVCQSEQRSDWARHCEQLYVCPYKRGNCRHRLPVWRTILVMPASVRSQPDCQWPIRLLSGRLSTIGQQPQFVSSLPSQTRALPDLLALTLQKVLSKPGQECFYFSYNCDITQGSVIKIMRRVFTRIILKDNLFYSSTCGKPLGHFLTKNILWIIFSSQKIFCNVNLTYII